MRSFPGKIGFPGETSSDVRAVITLADSRLEITTGETSIGHWPIADITLELGARGYVVILDGEELILAPDDRFGFRHAVEETQDAAPSSKRSRRRARKAAGKSTKPAKATMEKPSTEGVPVEAEPTPPDPPAPSAEVKPAKPAKAKKRIKRKPTKAPPPVDVPKEVPFVPGIDDLDDKAWWATRSEQGPTSFRGRLNTRAGIRQLAVGGAVIFLVLAYFAPAVVSLMLVIPGVAAVVAAALSLLDPSFTRRLPASLNEIRLMMIGLGLFTASLAVATIF